MQTLNLKKSYAIVTQSMGMISETFAIGKLEKEIVSKINNSSLKWNRKWMIVTQIFKTHAFTLLIGSRGRNKVKITTNVAVSAGGFNIANPKLDFSLSSSTGLSKKIFAQTNVVPFFRLHAIRGNWKSGELYLKPYGRK